VDVPEAGCDHEPIRVDDPIGRFLGIPHADDSTRPDGDVATSRARPASIYQQAVSDQRVGTHEKKLAFSG